MNQDLLFPTTVVGSMPRPQYLKDLVQARASGRLSFDAFQEMMDGAVPFVIQVQEQAGIDIVSDGEWRRVSYSDSIADLCHGFRYVTRETLGEVMRVPVVVDTIAPFREGLFAREARFLKARTRRGTKVAMPSPFLLGERLWDPDLSAGAYPTRRAFTEALIPILRRELILLRDAGVDIAQFDDTQLCCMVDPEIRARYQDPQGEMDYAVDALNRVAQGVDGVQLALHLCRRYKGRSGWFGEGGYEAVLPALKKLRFDLVLMEFAMPKAGEMDVLAGFSEGVQIGVGCIDCRAPDIEAPEIIAARVRKALDFVSPSRVFMQPDCGFAPGSDMEIPLDEAYGKLRNMACAARILRKEYRGQK